VGLEDGSLLSDLVEFFEQGAARHQGVLDLVGTDVAAFCDDLVKDSRTYADLYQESISRELGSNEA
jgi:DNA-binding ferritin-like protein (Dps family)